MDLYRVTYNSILLTINHENRYQNLLSWRFQTEDKAFLSLYPAVNKKIRFQSFFYTFAIKWSHYLLGVLDNVILE